MDNNKELAAIFKEMGLINRFLEGTNSFRATAYENAARTLEDLQEDVSQYVQHDQPKELKGIGKSIALKIKEYLDNGEIKKHEELRGKVPEELIDLMQVKGLGPQTLRKFYEDLGIDTRKKLDNALKDGSIEALDGFGKKKVENIQESLELKDMLEARIHLFNARRISDELVAELKDIKGVKKIEVAGSLRRGKETIGDIDILIAADKANRQRISNAFVELPGVKRILAHGETKSSVIIEEKDRQVDLRILEEDQWGAALLYFTGSQAHNVHIRGIAKDQGKKVSEYGVFREDTEELLARRTEEDMYQALDMTLVPPEMREDRGEVEAAMKGDIPELIELKDIKGDLHMHSDWSDGKHSIDDLADHIQEHFPYEYIALTDHTQSLRVAGGLTDDEVLQQAERIDELNDKTNGITILSGTEVDILKEGKLDLSNDTLKRLDWVVASIHTGFGENTLRLVKACENPHVDVIGHPTGRLIGSRTPYEFDLEKVLEAAKETNTALEINSQPQRLDLNDHMAKRAMEKGVWMVINTDTHQVENLNFMQDGVSVAKRAWCKKEQILNTRPWKEVQKILKN